MVTFDHEDSLRTMRQGVVFLLVFAVGALVGNLCDIPIVGSIFIGAIVGHLLYRLLWLNKKLRSVGKMITFAEMRIMGDGLIKRDVQ